jgi:hypothetical protein
MEMCVMQHDIQAQAIMHKFAIETGLFPTAGTNTPQEPRRYLWTDAFAVCNYLTFFKNTGKQSFLEQALSLVDQVHQVLGQHRKGNQHHGWLSGLSSEEALLHPTKGGLRIGKKLDERKVDEPFNESLEWDRDGQYFHYLTKWMYALNYVSRVTGNSRFNQWAMELAKAAHQAFVYIPETGGEKRMFWKMSIDLCRPLVSSMGQHDPLDGLITYRLLQSTAKQFSEWHAEPTAETTAELNLKAEIADMSAMCSGLSWTSHDPLAIGGLLSDAYRLAQLIDGHCLEETKRLERLLHEVSESLRAFVVDNPLDLPAERRLAFRELGLTIGLQAINPMQQHIQQHPEVFGESSSLTTLLTKLSFFQHFHEIIENFWLESNHQSVESWQRHADINNVMLAASLAPMGYLKLPPWL